MDIKDIIYNITTEYRGNLHSKMESRTREMIQGKQDKNEHYFIYNLLGVSNQMGQNIDLQQNIGRFLYKYAGSYVEKIVIACFKATFGKQAQEKIKIDNTIGQRPKTFEIDCLVNNNAYEIKWRDATTDGDHITKEHTRVQVIKEFGYNPIRIMFYYPNRKQAMRIQLALQTLYQGFGGEYHAGENAWNYVEDQTGIQLRQILKNYLDKSSI